MNATGPIVDRSEGYTSVHVDGRFVASVTARWALDWQGHTARFGWIVVDEVSECVEAEHRSRVVAEASAVAVARRYLPAAA